MAGKTTPRRGGSVSPQSGEGRQIGLDDREIPGGLPHIGNPDTHQTEAKVPARRHIPSINQHRVPDPDPDAPYNPPDDSGKVVRPRYAKLMREEPGVPVYEVEHPSKTPQYRLALCDNILVPAAGADPLPICGKDYARIHIKLLNEDANNDIRFSEDRTALLEGRGSLLWHGTNSYTEVPTQGELYAIAATTACLMSVIRVTEVNQ